MSQGLLLEAAEELARHAAGVAMRWYRRDVAVDTKGDGSPVTIADREAEQAARAWLAQRFPADGVMGEEFGVVRPEAPRRWIIDPIDGTKAFVRGVPLWGTLVACCEGETVLAGAVCYPVVDETLAAAVGEGCWWNGVRARVSAVDTLAPNNPEAGGSARVVEAITEGPEAEPWNTKACPLPGAPTITSA